MALPTDVATLYAWYRAGTLVLNDGDQIASWGDSSGNGRTMTGITALSVKPRFYSNQLAGYPAVEIVQADQQYFSNSAGFNWNAHLANHTLFIVYKVGLPTATGSIVSTTGGSQAEGIRYASPNIKKTQSAATGGGALAAMTAGEWHYVCGYQQNNVSVGISVDGGAEVVSAMGARGVTGTAGQIGVDGGAYCDGRIAEVIIYSSALSGADKDLINAYLRDKYFAAAPGQQEQMRDALSRRLWLFRRPQGLLQVTAPLWMLDADILDRVALELRTGPAPGGVGWRSKKWQRRAFSVQRIDVDLAGGTVKLQLLDRRPLDVLLWDSSRTDERNQSSRQSGVARLTKGVGFTFARQSKAWIENPADPTGLVECGQTERAISQVGEYLEEARTNGIPRSSFASGTTGLTLGGEGMNGSDISLNTTDLLFGTETTPNSLKFLAGNPHATELRSVFAATAAYTAGAIVRVSIDHRTESGEGLYWRLQRGVDSWFWNNATEAWQAGTVDNSMPAHSDRNPAARNFSEAIDVGASNTALTLSVFLQTGGTASRISYLYHVQIEEGTFPTSRIVTDGAAVTRVKSELSHEITTAMKSYDPALGAFWCQVTPDWSSPDLGAAEDQYVYWMETNGGADHDALLYDASAGAWIFERKVGASTYTASKVAAVTRGTTYSIGCRWTGAEGELDLAAYTVSVFVDGVKGADATSAAPTFSSPETLYRGSDSSFAKHVNAAVREVRILPYAPTDEEMARFP